MANAKGPEPGHAWSLLNVMKQLWLCSNMSTRQSYVDGLCSLSCCKITAPLNLPLKPHQTTEDTQTSNFTAIIQLTQVSDPSLVQDLAQSQDHEKIK